MRRAHFRPTSRVFSSIFGEVARLTLATTGTYTATSSGFIIHA
jgi:hypothetical protein